MKISGVWKFCENSDSRLVMWIIYWLWAYLWFVYGLFYEIVSKKTILCRRIMGWPWIRAVLSGDRIPARSRFSAPIQTGPGAHPAYCTMGTGSFPGVKTGRGVKLTPHLLLVPWSRKSRAIPLLPLWAVRPVQSFSACTWVHYIFYLYYRVLLKCPVRAICS